jgi:hypothetical protein
MHKLRLIGLFLACALFIGPAEAAGTSASGKVGVAPKVSRALNTVITFSEFPVGTHISNQYADKGIIFGGDDPFIATDVSNPTSPVLSGTPQFFGTIEGSFVRTDSGRRTALRRLELDAGYFDSVNSVRIILFDKKGNEILSVKNTQTGIQHFVFRNLPAPVHRFLIKTIGDEPNGFAIDNVAFNRKPPP